MNPLLHTMKKEFKTITLRHFSKIIFEDGKTERLKQEGICFSSM